MIRLRFTIVTLALWLAISTDSLSAQLDDNPIRDVDRWLHRAASAARQCDDRTHDLVIIGLAHSSIYLGDVKRFNELLDQVRDQKNLELLSISGYQLVMRGKIEFAEHILARVEGINRDRFLRHVGTALAEQYKFADSRSYAAKIVFPTWRNWAYGDLAESLARAGKYDEARKTMESVQPPAPWGDNLVEVESARKDRKSIPPEDDPLMQSAVNEARRHVEQMLKALKNPTPEQKYFKVRVLIEDGEQREHLWMTRVEIADDDRIIGTLLDTPEKVKNVSARQRLSVPVYRISDWSFWDGDKVIGAFNLGVESYKEWLVETQQTIKRLEEQQKISPPETWEFSSVAAAYRQGAGSFAAGLSQQDLRNPEQRAKVLNDPERLSYFWLKVAWHQFKNQDTVAMKSSLQNCVEFAERIEDPFDQSLKLILAADAYLELGDKVTAKSLVQKARTSSSLIDPLLQGIAGMTTGPVIVGVFVRSGEPATALEWMKQAGDENLDIASHALGAFCAAYDQLDFLDTNFDRLPTPAVKAHVASGVVEALVNEATE